jgi:hypothetical protein
MKKYEVVYLEVDEEEFESMCWNLNGWADGPENICCTSEQLIEFDALYAEKLDGFDGDVIITWT